jgi:uncharacterized protein (DUF433 family)
VKVTSASGIGYEDKVTIEPGKRGDKPCIRGMRITVYDMLECLAPGMNAGRDPRRFSLTHEGLHSRVSREKSQRLENN